MTNIPITGTVNITKKGEEYSFKDNEIRRFKKMEDLIEQIKLEPLVSEEYELTETERKIMIEENLSQIKGLERRPDVFLNEEEIQKTQDEIII